MKELSLILSIIRTRSVIIISVMTLLICTQQIHNNQNIMDSEKELSSKTSETESNESNPLTFLNLEPDIIVSNVQFNINHIFYEIMNIEQEEEDDFESTGVIFLPDGYRKILYCQVISPNAP